ncbi:MAG: hypothetical protein K1X35_07240 [Caulobacteraceae bacterium]|nr:hypothetical protein [Caulobacteraceae bacterium]
MKSKLWMAARLFLTLGLLAGAGLSAEAAPARPAPSAATAPNPTLNARVVGRGGVSVSDADALRIGRLDIDVRIAGRMAETTLVATFLNPSAQTLEGDFLLDLPAGSVVTGYGLDVNDHMIDGVLVNRMKGVEAYENRVRAGVDPGLAEVTRTGAFRTHVFPILPGKGRTVRLSFASPIAVGGDYRLPLANLQPVGAMRISAANGSIRYDGRVADGELRLSNARLTGELRIAPRPAATVEAARHHTGKTFIEVADTLGARGVAAPDTRRIRIYWDRSLSHRDDDLAAEIALAERYAETVKPQAIDLVLFNSDAPVTRTLQGPDLAGQLRAALRSVDYMGATSLRGVFEQGRPAAGQCLVFSDGNIDLDDFNASGQDCALFTISSAADADRGFLATLASRSGGEHFDLSRMTGDQAMARLISRNLRVTGVTDAAGARLDFVALPAPDGGFRLIAPAPERGGSLTVSLSGGEPRRYRIPDGEVVVHDGLGALWARAQLSSMSAQARPDHAEVERFARRWSVADGSVVFVVLETARDYAEAEIAPPQNAGKLIIDEYRELASAREKSKAAEREARLSKILAMWEEQKSWWNKTYAFPRERLTAQGASVREARRQERESRDLAAGSPPPPPPPPPAPPPPPVMSAEAAADEVTVTASRATSGPAGPAASGAAGRPIAIEIGEWKPDRPYLKALDEAPPEQFWSVYREQEKVNGALPAFYFDVAEWLFRKGRAEDARRVVVNVLELPVADQTTLIVLADRLMRYGETDRAIWVYEKVLYLDPDRPQPRRNLALALIQRAERNLTRSARPIAHEPRDDYQRALDLLTEVVMRPWEGRYDGVEMIALMEANRILPRVRDFGGTVALDSRLADLLDTDLRIILEWNTDHTDMDLWVDEPSGERAIYSHPRTVIGGRLSNDMTQGYGPEEYLLRRAMPGTYEVRVNVYASDRLNPNGGTVVRARIFRNWGRPDQEEQTLELELTKGARGTQLVGKIQVGGPRTPAPRRMRPPRTQ